MAITKNVYVARQYPYHFGFCHEVPWKCVKDKTLKMISQAGAILFPLNFINPREDVKRLGHRTISVDTVKVW